MLKYNKTNTNKSVQEPKEFIRLFKNYTTSNLKNKINLLKGTVHPSFCGHFQCTENPRQACELCGSTSFLASTGFLGIPRRHFVLKKDSSNRWGCPGQWSRGNPCCSCNQGESASWCSSGVALDECGSNSSDASTPALINRRSWG